MSEIPRPSHADFTYQAKYGVKAGSGGGRSSARETIGVLLQNFLSTFQAGLPLAQLLKNGSNFDSVSKSSLL